MASLEDLTSFPHYFLYWLGDFHLTPDVAEDMKGETRFTRPESFADDMEEFSSWGMMTLQGSVSPFLLGFLELMSGDIEGATVTLDYIKDMVEYLAGKEFMKDYLPGLHYLSRMLNRHFFLVATQFNPEEPEWDPSFQQDKLVQDYEKLKPMSKSILAIANWMMNESIREREEAAVTNLKDMVSLDPTNWVWHYHLCNRTRFLRRTLGRVHIFHAASHPWPEEIEAAVNSVKYSSHKLHYQLMCTAALSQCLAEIVRAKTDARDFSPIVADKKYQTLSDVVVQITEAACDALTEISCGFPEYIRYGEIFGLILPKQHRDYMVAAACMNIACVLAPASSKVNHKMGSIILSWKKDAKRAINYLTCAVQAESHNFPAWLDLLPAMLSNFEENKETFESLFQIVKKREADWTPTQRGAFAFFEGCVAFLSGNKADAIKLWLKSVSPPGDYEGFQGLQGIGARCGWPKVHALTYDAVLNTIDSFEWSPENAEKVLRLKEIVSKAKADGLQFFERQRQNSDRIVNTGESKDFRQERQPRFPNSNSTSDADNGNRWRRGTGSPGSGDSTLTEQFRPFGITNQGQGGRGSGGTRDEGVRHSWRVGVP